MRASASSGIRRFGIVGYGWRADFYLRIAQKLPEVFECVGMVVRTAQAGAAIEEQWGVPTYRTIAELTAKADVDAIVVCVPPTAAYPVIAELVSIKIPVLTETPPSLTIDGLANLWHAVGASGLVLVAEQHPYLPVFAATQHIIESGSLGEVSAAFLSWTHEYHAVAVLRRLAGLAGPNTRITASSTSVPLLDGPDRKGPGNGVYVRAQDHTTAILESEGRTAVYDFTATQWFNPLRRRQVSVRGSLGEIVGTDVTWAADGEFQSAPIVRRQLGLDGNLEGIGLDKLSWAGTTVYRNPFRGACLSDEEIAIATCLYEATDPDGPSGYSLADGCEDRYLSLLIGFSADRRAPVTAEVQPWTQALSSSSQQLDHTTSR